MMTFRDGKTLMIILGFRLQPIAYHVLSHTVRINSAGAYNRVGGKIYICMIAKVLNFAVLPKALIFRA